MRAFFDFCSRLCIFTRTLWVLVNLTCTRQKQKRRHFMIFALIYVSLYPEVKQATIERL